MPERVTAPGDAPGLLPVLGPFDTTMLVMGSIIGAGVFRAPAQIAAGMGSLEGVLAIWTLGGVIAMSGALVIAELGGMLPRSGGQYVFLRETFGRFFAFLFGWILITAIVSSAIAYVAGVFAEHLDVLARALFDAAPFGGGARRMIASGLIVALAWLNVRGVSLGARVQNLAMLAKIGGMLLIVGLGAAVLFGITTAEVPAQEPAAAARAFNWSGAGAALLGVVFTYGGWQNVAAVAGEIRRPERNLPLGVLAGTAAVVGLYLALNLALIGILGVDGVAATPTPVAAAAAAVVPWGGALVAALVLLSTFAITQVLLMLAPRIYYAMAVDGVFFKSAARVHPRYRTPAVAILLQGLLALIHVQAAGELNDLLELTTLCDWVFFSACGIALFVLRRTRPDAPRPYRAFGYPWVPGIFVVTSLLVVVNAAANAQRGPVLRSSALFAVGALLYLVWSRRGARAAATAP